MKVKTKIKAKWRITTKYEGRKKLFLGGRKRSGITIFLFVGK